jgi:hypothetical protein
VLRAPGTGAGADEGAAVGTSPAWTGGAVRNGIVCTPVALAVAASPGGETRNTWPTEILFTFSMLFQAASSR